MPDSEVVCLLESDRDRGLTNFEITRRRQHFEPNVLTPKKGKNPLILFLFLLQFHQAFLYILLGATAITAVLQEWVDAGVIFSVMMVLFQLLFTYAPAMQLMFGTKDLGGAERMLIIAVGTIIYSVVGIRKGFNVARCDHDIDIRTRRWLSSD